MSFRRRHPRRVRADLKGLAGQQVIKVRWQLFRANIEPMPRGVAGRRSDGPIEMTFSGFGPLTFQADTGPITISLSCGWFRRYGDIVIFFRTGPGQTNPGGVDG